MQIKINKNISIGGKKTFIIAEIGSNHNQSLSLAKEHIDAAIEAGADAVKNLRPFLGPPGEGPSAAEFGVIRMGADHQDPFSLFLFPNLFFQSVLSGIYLKFQRQKTYISPASP